MNWLINSTHTEPTNEELGINPSLKMSGTVIALTAAFWIAVALIAASFA